MAPERHAATEVLPVSELINVFPTALLGAMIVLTLLLLPLLGDERPARDDRQRTEELRVAAEVRKMKDER
jgi:hypothetical protein